MRRALRYYQAQIESWGEDFEDAKGDDMWTAAAEIDAALKFLDKYEHMK
jgi:hypothetical protein